MRKIDKGAPLESFSKFVRTHPHARWEDAKDMSHIWRKHMLNCEQHGMSGYTEEPLKTGELSYRPFSQEVFV